MTWSINKIVPVHIALESDTHHITIEKDSVRFKKSTERKSSNRADPRDQKLFKICLVGDCGVGKTAINIRYAEQKYGEDGEGFIRSTTGWDFKIRTVERNKDSVKLEIWDTAGQERYRHNLHAYYRKTDAIIVVYNVTNRFTFDNLDR